MFHPDAANEAIKLITAAFAPPRAEATAPRPRGERDGGRCRRGATGAGRRGGDGGGGAETGGRGAVGSAPRGRSGGGGGKRGLSCRDGSRGAEERRRSGRAEPWGRSGGGRPWGRGAGVWRRGSPRGPPSPLHPPSRSRSHPPLPWEPRGCRAEPRVPTHPCTPGAGGGSNGARGCGPAPPQRLQPHRSASSPIASPPAPLQHLQPHCIAPHP